MFQRGPKVAAGAAAPVNGPWNVLGGISGRSTIARICVRLAGLDRSPSSRIRMRRRAEVEYADLRRALGAPPRFESRFRRPQVPNILHACLERRANVIFEAGTDSVVLPSFGLSLTSSGRRPSPGC